MNPAETQKQRETRANPTTRKLRRWFAPILSAVSAVAVLAAGSARADSYTWNGAVDNLWTNSSNWSGGPIGGVPAAADTVTFNNGTGATALDLSGGGNALNVLFDTAAAAAYTIGSSALQTLTLNDGGMIQMNNSVTRDQNINASIVLGTAASGSYGITNAAAARSLFFRAGVSGGTGGDAGAKTLTIGGIKLVEVDGNITDGGALSLSVAKYGAGTLFLNAMNSFSGGLTLYAGILGVDTPAALGTGPFTIGAGATFNNATGLSISNINNNVQNWNGNFTFTGSGSLDMGTGPVTMGSSLTVTASRNILQADGPVSGGAFSLTKAGNGTLAFSGTNAYSGGSIVNAGNLSWLRTASLPSSGTASVPLAAGYLATMGFGVSGSGAFTATDLNNLFAGTFVGDVANVSLRPLALIGIDTTFGDFTYSPSFSASAYGLNKIGANTLTVSGAIPVQSVVASGGTLIIDGTVTITNSSGVFAVGSGSGSLATVTLTPNAAVTFLNGTAFGIEIGGLVNVGTGNLGNAGAGTLNLEGGTLTLGPAVGGLWMNPFSASGGVSTFNLDSGVLNTGCTIQDGGGNKSVVNLNGAVIRATADTVLLGNPGNYALGKFYVRNGGEIIDSQGFNVTIGSAQLHTTNPSDNPIDGGLTKVGSGSLTLLANNTYTGPTTISNGVLRLGGHILGGGAVNVIAPAALSVVGASGQDDIIGPVSLTEGNAGIYLTNSVADMLSLSGGLTLSNGNFLAFALGTAQNRINLNGSAFSQSGKTTIYLSALGGFGLGTYNIIVSAASISASDFVLGTTNLMGIYDLALTNPDSMTLAVVVTSHIDVPPVAFWDNRFGTQWTVATNWDNDASSGVPLTALPSTPTAVYFGAAGATDFNTVLGANFSIASLTFNTPNNVTIGGANTLTLFGDITVNSGAGSNTLNASAVNLALSQTWTVTDWGNTLWVNSAVGGSASLTVSGGGTLALAGANTFTGTALNNGAMLEIAPPGSLTGAASFKTSLGGTTTIHGLVRLTNAAGEFVVGAGTAGTSTLIVKPGGQLDVLGGSIFIGGKDSGAGDTGTGYVNIEGGAVNIGASVSTPFYLNPYAAADSTLNLDGGVLTTAVPILDGGGNRAVFNLNGGVLRAGGNTVLLGNPGNYGLGTYNVRNGGEIVDTQGYDATIGAAQRHSNISGDNEIDGGLTKLGTGSLTLLAASTYNGGTIVSAGTLLVNNTTGSGTGEGSVVVQTNATLGGSGSIGGAVTVESGGTLAPGPSAIGTLTINSNLTLAGNLFIRINKSASASNSWVTVSGTLTNAGNGTVTVANLGMVGLKAGDSFQLFSQPLLNGQALTITPAPGSGLAWSNNLALNGSIAVVSTAVEVPVLSSIVTFSGSSCSLSFSGASGQGYTVLMSTNVALPMADWTPLTSGVFGASPVNFTDTGATNAQRFYRIASY